MSRSIASRRDGSKGWRVWRERWRRSRNGRNECDYRLNTRTGWQRDVLGSSHKQELCGFHSAIDRSTSLGSKSAGSLPSLAQAVRFPLDNFCIFYLYIISGLAIFPTDPLPAWRSYRSIARLVH